MILFGTTLRSHLNIQHLDYILENPTHLSTLLQADVDTPQANAGQSLPGLPTRVGGE
jgi:hypothetical protein